MSQNKLEYETQVWSIDKLIPYARNPRINDNAVPMLAGLIKEFGFKVPILVKSDGEIIDGHERYKAAQLLKLKEVPVWIVDGWTDVQVKAFRLAVNKSAEWAKWDDNLLKLELQELTELNFDLKLIDFADFDLKNVSYDSDTVNNIVEDDIIDNPIEDEPAPNNKFTNKELKDLGDNDNNNDNESFTQNRLIIVYKDNEKMFIKKLLHLNNNEKIAQIYNAGQLAERFENEHIK